MPHLPEKQFGRKTSEAINSLFIRKYLATNSRQLVRLRQELQERQMSAATIARVLRLPRELLEECK